MNEAYENGQKGMSAHTFPGLQYVGRASLEAEQRETYTGKAQRVMFKFLKHNTTIWAAFK